MIPFQGLKESQNFPFSDVYSNVIAGNTEQRKVILQGLQKLTNDRLMVGRDGTVYIYKYGAANSDKKLTEGTRLVRELNAKGPDAKTTKIETTDGSNKTTAESSDAIKKSDGTKGSGANATVDWNPTKTNGGTDVNGSDQRPPEIGLGHELEHAEHDNKGENDQSSSGKVDPDGSGNVLSKEELNTRKDENKIRKEQNLPNRKVD